jgi:hypothetical protein
MFFLLLVEQKQEEAADKFSNTEHIQLLVQHIQEKE